MPWLWVFPILLSAIFDADRKRRLWHLAGYSMAVGFVLGGVFGGGATPRFVSIRDMALGIVLYSPFVFALSWGLEHLAQRGLCLVLQFELSDRCSKCGYCIRHLDRPRCPECGEPFDEKWLDESFQPPRAAKHPWRTRMIAGLLVALGAGAPFVYHEYALLSAAARGRGDAETDWERGEAVLYLGSEEGLLTSDGTYDIDSGLRLRRIRGGLEDQTYARAYREVIDSKLRRFGAPPRPAQVLTRDDVRTLLASDRLSLVGGFPFRLNDRVTVSRDSEYTTVSLTQHDGSSSFSIGSSAHVPVRHVTLGDHGGVVVLVLGDWLLMTLSPDGYLLQEIWVEGGEVEDFVP
jgi:hypothetical protein